MGERSLFSSLSPLSPSKAILRIFEAISSGLLQEDGPGIKDPCERNKEDVLRHLSTQEREDITRSAQEAVRMIHHRKTHELLDMVRLDPRADKEEEEDHQEPV